MLKSSTSVKCHFGRQLSFFVCFGGTSQKCVLQKFLPFIVKASPTIPRCKIQCLHFVNRNIGGFQSGHSSRHFQNSNNSCNFDCPTLTQHWLRLRLGKYNYMWTWVHQTELGEEWSHKSIETWNIGCIDVSVITRSYDENMDWAKNFDTWKLTKNLRTLPLKLDDD